MTRDQNDDFTTESCDVVIVFDEHGLANTTSALIFKEIMVAVSHPDLLPSAQPFDLHALAKQKLLYLTSSDHLGD